MLQAWLRRFWSALGFSSAPAQAGASVKTTRRDPLSGYSERERALLERYWIPEDEVEPWSWDPIPTPSPMHLHCPDCFGEKVCPECGGPGIGHPYCDGFCRWCGGAGQLPIHPGVPTVRPPPSVNRYPRPTAGNTTYLRKQLLKELQAREPTGG